MTIFEQSIEKQALLPIHLAKGIELCESDPDTLVLKYGDEIIARYSSTGAFADQIRKDADDYLGRINKKDNS